MNARRRHWFSFVAAAACLAVLLGAALLLGHFHRLGFFPSGEGAGAALVSSVLMGGLASLLFAVGPFLAPGLLFRFVTPAAARSDDDACAGPVRAGWLSFEWAAVVGWVVGAFLAVWFWRGQIPAVGEMALAILGGGLAGWFAGRFCHGAAATLEAVDAYAWCLFLLAWAAAAATVIYVALFVVAASPFLAAALFALALLANRLAAASGPQVAGAASAVVVAGWLTLFFASEQIALRLLAASGHAGQTPVHLLLRAEACRGANLLANGSCAWSEKEALGALCEARLLWRGGDWLALRLGAERVAPVFVLRTEGVAAWRSAGAGGACPPKSDSRPPHDAPPEPPAGRGKKAKS